MTFETPTTGSEEAPQKRPVLLVVAVVFFALLLVYRLASPWTSGWVDFVALGIIGVAFVYAKATGLSQQGEPPKEKDREDAP